MKTLLASLAFFGLVLASVTLKAQDSNISTSLPNAPDAQTTPPDQAAPLGAGADKATSPVLAPPESVHGKFMDYAVATFGPRSLVTPALPAAMRMANIPKGYPHDWHSGAGAFGRNYGDFLASRTAGQTARFLTSSLLQEDVHYQRSSSTNPLARSFHALSFTFVDKSDSGHNRIAFANFMGAGASGFVGNLYLPPGFNNDTHAEARTAFAFGDYAAQNLALEFSPEIRELTRKLHVPFPHIPVPEWWVRRDEGN